jgi:hypothetical protein
MLDVKIIMNSAMEEVLGFKCCGLPDQNLEMHIRNIGDHPVTVSGSFDLENEKETLTCSHLFPPWEQTIPPKEAVAFYCSMDESVWNRYQTLTVSDKEGNVYRFSTNKITDSG